MDERLPMKVVPDAIGPGQESVWSYPRPPVAQAVQRNLKVVHHGIVVAATRSGIRTLETSHPPSYYFPPDDVSPFVLRKSRRRSFCEWKGEAVYFDVVVNGEIKNGAAWSYPDPIAAFSLLRNYIAFYVAPSENCFVDSERATPQPGNYYGGWVTSFVAGPFKGVAGSESW